MGAVSVRPLAQIKYVSAEGLAPRLVGTDCCPLFRPFAPFLCNADNLNHPFFYFRRHALSGEFDSSKLPYLAYEAVGPAIRFHHMMCRHANKFSNRRCQHLPFIAFPA